MPILDTLSSIFKPKQPALTKAVTAGAGGMRDAYLQHISDQAELGKPALSWEEWLKTQAQQKPVQ